MNYETGLIREASHDAAIADDLSGRASRKRWIVIALIVGAALLTIGFFWWRSASSTPVVAAKQVPTVSVTVPGRRTVDAVINTTGNLAARREMPVGVAGEGGMIARVLVEPGTWVREGQVLATVDRSVQAQQANALNAQIAVAQADVRLAEANLQRAQALVARGFISKADIDRLTSTRDAARARTQVARAQFGQALASNSRLDIRAPAAGLVLERRVEPGQVVSAGSGVLFRIARGGEMEMLARLGEADLANTRVGQRATVTPVGSSKSFTGAIWQVAPIIDPQTRQGIVRVALGYDPAIRPGGFGSARIVGGTSSVPLLPESAIQTDVAKRTSYVLIVGRDNRIERRDVTVGEVSDAGVAIAAGLNGTEAVVVSAGAFLNPGEQIIPQRVKTG